MKISGRSYINGIEFKATKYKAGFKYDKKKNETRIYLQKNEEEKETEILDKLMKIPIIRALVVIYRNTKFLLILCLIFIVLEFFLYEHTSKPKMLENALSMMATTLIMCGTVRILNFFQTPLRTLWEYHGAEHKVIDSYVKNENVCFENVIKADRVTPNCGTIFVTFYFINLILIRMIVALLGIQIYTSVVFFISCVLAMELFLIDENKPIIRYVYKIGFWLQRECFTYEPDHFKLIQAIDTFELLMILENGEIEKHVANRMLKEEIIIKHN